MDIVNVIQKQVVINLIIYIMKNRNTSNIPKKSLLLSAN